jgi:diguanylate cyclase (GGDEF)-like protein
MAGLQAGADDYLTLPLNPLELRLRVKNAKRLLNLEDELREGAGLDEMTNVVNFASFREFFRMMLADYIRTKRHGVLMYVRINDYDQAFAEHGYDTTRRMMSELAAVLRRSARDCDLVARHTDDEFCVMLHDTHWDKCTPAADRIIANAESISIVVGDETLYPNLTINAINFPIEGLDVDEILTLSERIPYAA